MANRPQTGSHRSHFRHCRKIPTFGRKRPPSGACLRSRGVIAGAHVREMAADPSPPSAMAQPGPLNLNNEVSTRVETVGCGASSRRLPPRGQQWVERFRKGGARPPRTPWRPDPRAGRVPGLRLRTLLSVRPKRGSLSVQSLLIVLCKMKLRVVSSSEGCKIEIF